MRETDKYRFLDSHLPGCDPDMEGRALQEMTTASLPVYSVRFEDANKPSYAPSAQSWNQASVAMHTQGRYAIRVWSLCFISLPHCGNICGPACIHQSSGTSCSPLCWPAMLLSYNLLMKPSGRQCNYCILKVLYKFLHAVPLHGYNKKEITL